MPGKPEVSRGEFLMLRDQVTANAVRLDAIDSAGTRGVAVLASQVTEVVKDVAELRATMEHHDGRHEREQRMRMAGRRWSLGFAVAASVSLIGILTLLVDIVQHVHK